MYYIYFLMCPITLQVMYIGYTTNPTKRLSRHMCDIKTIPEYRSQRSDIRIRWIIELKQRKMKAIMAIVDESETLAEARIKESELIRKYYPKITNISK